MSDSDWVVDLVTRTVTHTPSGARCSFYSYPNPEECRSPAICNFGERWDEHFNSENEMALAATNVFRRRLGLGSIR